MAKEKQHITQGGVEVFLIYDESFKRRNPPFMEWLKSEGFAYAGRRGEDGGCNWIYVNISRKLYAWGMPYFRFVNEIGNHAITMEEFHTIYSIYKKYEGKDTFVFSSNSLRYRMGQNRQFFAHPPHKLWLLGIISWMRKHLNRLERRLLEGLRDSASSQSVEVKTPAEENKENAELFFDMEKCTMEGFKEVIAKEMRTCVSFQTAAEDADISLDQYCRAYIDYMEVEDESRRFQELYENVLDGNFPFEYWAGELVRTWEFKEVPMEEISRYLK